uniref:Large ribosomal subunit protein eL14 n=1 Tax=Griffithsia japonica TaxID=83288 RepID=RL14_GRIJA|nr:RecName: Full=Large ribosomal subunit protein eL14; AltName: Full=60S ribosomal protein L14 [Griffithsia japonica]AAP80695.1 ribosome protein L14 [Griffithsia japonica]
MTFTRFVEAGRVALVSYGEHLNKLVVIVDILDQNRILVDSPSHGLKRKVINVKRIALTSIKVDDIARGAPVAEVKSKYTAAKVDETFAASGWGKKLAKREKRAALDDFGRFKVMVARMKKSKAINAELAKLKA